MHLLSKLDITRHDGVKCHELNLDQPVSRKQLLALQNSDIIFYNKVHKEDFYLGNCDHTCIWHDVVKCQQKRPKCFLNKR